MKGREYGEWGRNGSQRLRVRGYAGGGACVGWDTHINPKILVISIHQKSIGT